MTGPIFLFNPARARAHAGPNEPLMRLARLSTPKRNGLKFKSRNERKWLRTGEERSQATTGQSCFGSGAAFCFLDLNQRHVDKAVY